MADGLRICFDRIVTTAGDPARAANEEAARDPGGLTKSAVAGLSPQRAALIESKRWPAGKALRVRFLGGTPYQRTMCAEKAIGWAQFADITFDFVPEGPAEIRVAFRTGEGSWSALGTDALVTTAFPDGQPTMNFGWLDERTAEDEWSRVVLHEFGHALGLIHEHQSPKAALRWDVAAVYAAFGGPPNYWSRSMIDDNILARYGPDGIVATEYDDKSIMLYQFDARLFVDRKPTPNNTKLSARDIELIGRMYPKAKPKPNPKARAR